MTMANQSLKHHAQIMDLLPDLIIGVDRDGIIHYVSKSVLSRLQYSEATMLGASFHKLVRSLADSSNFRLFCPRVQGSEFDIVF